MVSFHSLLGLRTGLSEMGTCRVDSCKRQNSRHLALVACEGRHEKGKGLGRGSHDALSCKLSFREAFVVVETKPKFKRFTFS